MLNIKRAHELSSLKNLLTYFWPSNRSILSLFLSWKDDQICSQSCNNSIIFTSVWCSQVLFFVPDFYCGSSYLLFPTSLHCVLSQVPGLPFWSASDSSFSTFLIPWSCQPTVLLLPMFQVGSVLSFKVQGLKDGHHLNSCNHRCLKRAFQRLVVAFSSLSLCLLLSTLSFYLPPQVVASFGRQTLASHALSYSRNAWFCVIRWGCQAMCVH